MTNDGIPLADGSTVSREEGFTAWLAMNDHLVEDEFLVFDVAGMPANPYSEGGLKIAEAEALRRFSDKHDAVAIGNREMFDKFVRFIGSAFVSGLGGEWTNKPLVDDGKAFVGIRFPWMDELLNVPTLVTAAMTRRTGDEWAFVYRRQQKRRDSWSAKSPGTG